MTVSSTRSAGRSEWLLLSAFGILVATYQAQRRTLVAPAMGGVLMNHFATYGRLRDFLLDLGFEDRSGDYLAFSHPEVRSALLCMALHEPDEPMLERDVVKVRGVLELSGLMERDEFDAWVRNKRPQKATAS